MTTATSNPTNFLEQLETLPELKPFPASASQILSVCNDPEITSGQLAEIIMRDPALAGRLMKVSNSSMYGFSGRISTVEHAVVLLGFRAVRDLALAMAGADVFAQGATAKQERLALWYHSLATATIARLLAKKLKTVAAEEAFLAGIFHDVGKLIFFDLVPEQYLKITSLETNQDQLAEERSQFGIDHAELGLDCADEWGLPAQIANAIGFHHAPDSAEEDSEIAELIGMANQFSKLWKLETDQQSAAEEEETETADHCETYAIDTETLKEIEAAAREEYHETIRVCQA